MNYEEIINGNKLIAKFMGLNNDDNPDVWEDDKNAYTISFLKYHSSYDRLMPVVEKINTIAIDNYGEMGVYIKPYICFIASDENDPLFIATIANHPKPIEMVWTVVVTFIQWYNNQ